jgi:hypothetical protein
MPRIGSDIVFATMIILWCGSFNAGCTRDEPAAEKQQAPSVAATAAPSVAATQAEAKDDPYEDALVLLAEGDPDSGPAPLVVQFEVESLVVDEIAGGRYTWDFGDGSPKSNEANPSHTYAKAGEYTATVHVVDAAGQQGIDEVDVLVEEPEDRGVVAP